jgi:hypothetical protein
MNHKAASPARRQRGRDRGRPGLLLALLAALASPVAAGPEPDCDRDGVPDAREADCDRNGIPDECEIPAAPFQAASGVMSPIGGTAPQTWTLVAPQALAGVTITVTASADLNASNEFFDILLNGTGVGSVFNSGGLSCTTVVGLLSVPAAVYNAAFAGGTLHVTIQPSPAVAAGDCPPGSTVSVALDYVGFDLAFDCNGNGTHDGCETDCNGNGVPDECDLLFGGAPDCNGNGVPDACDLDDATSPDFDGNGVPDECDPDCDGDGIPDFIELAFGLAQDCDRSSVPDACEIAQGVLADCDGSGVPDGCEVADGTAPDCNRNGVPDGCDVAGGGSQDFDGNGVPDECQPDCNGNGVPDFLDLLFGLSEDQDGDGVPDECHCPADVAAPADGQVNVMDLVQVVMHWNEAGGPADVNGDDVVDVGDLAAVALSWGPCP